MKTNIIKAALRFTSFLFIITFLVALIHLLALHFSELAPFDNKFVLAYVTNFLLAIGIFTALLFLQQQGESNLGFIFMTGSMVKLGLFFILFYPSYKIDGDVSRLEFSTFFIPYAVCLFTETFFLTRLLNQD